MKRQIKLAATVLMVTPLILLTSCGGDEPIEEPIEEVVEEVVEERNEEYKQ